MTELIREYWSLFLLDTLVWTGALIGVALLLRRPVAKYLGAGAAYALWFLPLIRLLFPPVTLPAWMRPDLSGSDAASEVMAADLAFAPAAENGFSYSEFVSPAGTAPLDTPIDLLTPLVILWLVGAAIFMGRRFWLYGELRHELLEDARPVGEVGHIRLIETTAISGPMAFGVFDKVVALPDGFMASRERQVRDLAIAHELAHHRGHDILVNVLVQPLFAIHWFNPLGWMGWSAMRRDQEAACDARVVASRSREERAAYAAIIADFARRPQIAPRPALAAPMACPVLGDKSIIHRLRSLPMTDDSRRRRFAVRGAVVAAVFTLPMTASIGYAEVISASPEESFALQTPVAPPPPFAPVAPEAPESVIEFVAIEQGFERAERQRELAAEKRELAAEKREEAAEKYEKAAEKREKAAEKRKHADKLRAKQVASYTADRQQWVEGRIEHARGRQEWAVQTIASVENRVAHAEATSRRMEAHVEVGGEWGKKLDEEIPRSVAVSIDHGPKVIESCRYPDVPAKKVKSNGEVFLYVCHTAGDRIALKSLAKTRDKIAGNTSLPDEVRRDMLEDLDAEIRELKRSLRG
ncbi:M56 family metallopeptidase [Qipengyuania sp. SS22]|uniref:M56 family metallopeptidase n=1 Tax=Qipengyuania sp. SS22 TaxID=2979461 RepID=UPI0021E5835F|nr:M56 family metallopeptidase [Qipengyuania sp. SS22]UYH55973.1 M56 family metallopeptidase [Qipengyuania sp. SS22]